MHFAAETQRFALQSNVAGLHGAGMAAGCPAA
jgi:hypothetical protein